VSKIDVSVEIFYNKVKKKLEQNKGMAQRALDMAVIKDSARFVPFDVGTLEGSALRGTNVGSGLVVYNAPYARAQYYGKFDHSRNKHPQATRLWFEAAKTLYFREWVKTVQEIMAGKSFAGK
jgi:hypothetical protein